MDRVSYYIDYGSGFVRIYPKDNALKLLWVRGEINPFIARKKLSGSFKLNSTEAQTAFTYFITNGNYEAPIKLYEHGTSSTGTLIFEGFAIINLEYFYQKSVIEFNNFRTDDIYEKFLPHIKRQTPLPQIFGVPDLTTVLIQDQTYNSLQGYAWGGTDYARIVTGKHFS